MADQTNISKAQKLLEEMNAKYGATPSAPAKQPTQPPQQQVQPPQQRGLVNDAMSLIKGRQQQIDKASGYACGGKVKAHASGGKVKTIKGPGTSTSDSIPAKVKETGEPILVSNGERILSKKQDKLLEKIAKMLGYETTDDLLASGTGRSVGPTMKDGKRAAGKGWGTNNDDEDAASIYDPAYDALKKIPEQAFPNTMSAIQSGGDAAKAAADAGNYGGALGQVGRGAIGGIVGLGKDVMNSAAYVLDPAANALKTLVTGDSAPINKPAPSYITNPSGLLKEATAPGYGPQDGPQQAAGSATNQATSPLITGRNDKGIITADSAQSAYGNDMGRSGKVFGTYDGKGVNDILARENAARADMIAMSMPQVGGTAPGILGNGSLGTLPGGQSIEEWNRNVGVKTQIGLGPKARAIYEDQAAKNELQRRGQDFTRETSMYGNDAQAKRAAGHDQMLMRGQDMQAQSESARLAGNPMDNRIKGAQVSSLEELAKLRGNLLNAKTPEEQAKATALLRAYSGNTEENKPWAHVVGGGVDEVTGQQRPQYIVTGRGDQATTASTGADIAKRGQRIGNSPYDEGTILNKDGKKYVVKNGQPVLAS